jgi:hypothetical protein
MAEMMGKSTEEKCLANLSPMPNQLGENDLSGTWLGCNMARGVANDNVIVGGSPPFLHENAIGRT